MFETIVKWVGKILGVGPHELTVEEIQEMHRDWEAQTREWTGVHYQIEPEQEEGSGWDVIY